MTENRLTSVTSQSLPQDKLGYNLGICSIVLRRSNNTRFGQTACLFPDYKVLIGRILFRKLFGLYKWHNFKAYKVTFQNGTVCWWWHDLSHHTVIQVWYHWSHYKFKPLTEEKRNRCNELCKSSSSVSVGTPLHWVKFFWKIVQDFSKALDALLCTSFSREAN